MCGIFGFSANPAIMNRTMAKLVLNKIKILGMYNIDRGKHSCGLYINDQIIKGVDDLKIFSDFIAKKWLPDATKSGNYTIMGHTRAATVGSHTAANAHPFLVDDRFVLAHNGGIKNIWELCDKHGVDYTNIDVDSHALAHLIYKKGFKVLEEYKGFAALLMAYRDNPNILHFYRGSSKRYQMAQAIEEERPLYYLQANEGVYLSSIEKSLMAISDEEADEIQIVPASTVFTIENGQVNEDCVYIDRGVSNYGIYQNTTTCDPKRVGVIKATNSTPATGIGGTIGTSLSDSRNNLEKIVPVIWHEGLPSRISRWKFNEGIIYHLGRFWIVDNQNIRPANGAYYANNKGRITPDRKPNRFFLDGVMMKNQKAYEMAKVDPNIANPNWNYMMFMSKYSEYPICATRMDINNKCKDVPPHSKYRWYENEAQVGNKSFTPMFSDRHYAIKEGLLDKIIASKTIEKEVLINQESLAAERKAVEDLKAKSSLVVVHGPKSDLKEEGEARLNVGSVVDDVLVNTVKLSEFIKKNNFNNELPFKDEKIKIFKGDDLDVTTFHMKFESVDQALETFTREEQRAIRYFIADVMTSDGVCKVYNVYEDTVDMQFKMFLQLCIDNDATVVDNWNQDEFNDIPHYLVTAKNNVDGSYIDYVDNEEVEDQSSSCCYVPPKPEKKVMGVQQGWFVMDTDEAELLNAAKASDDEEPPFIDLVYEREKRKFTEYMGIQVLEDNTDSQEVDEEEHGFRLQETFKPVADISNTFDDDEEEKSIAFEETVDSLLKARDEADAFQALVNDDFSQEIAYTLYRGIDPILQELQNVAEKYKEKKSEDYIKRNIKERVNS